MHKIFKEPLIHFFLIGCAIYGVYLWLTNQNQDTSPIIVNEGKVKQLVTMHKKIWQREPNNKELDNLIQEYLLEEIAYREGIALGLDLNDIVIKRRVRQKLDFIAEESLPRPSPTDQILKDYMNQHPEKFRQDDLYTFRHIFFDKARHDDVVNQANQLLIKLRKTPNIDTTNLGAGYFFKRYYQSITIDKLDNVFGKKFSQMLVSTSAQNWHGPLQTDFGSHLVYIEKIDRATKPKLVDMRVNVLREWEHDLRKQATSSFYQKLLAKYEVIIQRPLAYKKGS
ncbi:peptidyl-prolyl cis-trans isomerase [Colwelliaceae bacterium MEBiC 14330]